MIYLRILCFIFSSASTQYVDGLSSFLVCLSARVHLRIYTVAIPSQYVGACIVVSH